MRPSRSHGLLAVCALFATQALAQRPKAPRPPRAASTLRTLQLGPDSTIQYAAEPGDERSTGTLSVLPVAPSIEPTPPPQEPSQPREQEEAAPSTPPASPSCGELRAKLAVRLLQLRGLDVDEVAAAWIWQRISVFGDELPLSALQSDFSARNLAVELAQCEAAAAR